MLKILKGSVVLLLITLFLIGDYSASMYGKELFGIFAFTFPKSLVIKKVDAQYGLFDSNTGLAFVMHDTPFPTDVPVNSSSIYVSEILKYCDLGNSFALQVRTSKNEDKVIWVREIDGKLDYKIIDTKPFFSDKGLLTCVGLEYTPYFIKLWYILGSAVLLAVFVGTWDFLRSEDSPKTPTVLN